MPYSSMALHVKWLYTEIKIKQKTLIQKFQFRFNTAQFAKFLIIVVWEVSCSLIMSSHGPDPCRFARQGCEALQSEEACSAFICPGQVMLILYIPIVYFVALNGICRCWGWMNHCMHHNILLTRVPQQLLVTWSWKEEVLLFIAVMGGIEHLSSLHCPKSWWTVNIEPSMVLWCVLLVH